MRLRLAVLQPRTLVILQHTVLAAEVALAEAAVADDALRGFFAVFEGATNFLGGHSAEDGEGDVEGAVLRYVQSGERGW